MGRRLKKSTKVYFVLILFFLSSLLILISYNSCALNTGFQPDVDLSTISPTERPPLMLPKNPPIIIPPKNPLANVSLNRSFGIKINNGARFTKDLNLSLGLSAPSRYSRNKNYTLEMKISKKPGCGETDGNWEPYSPIKEQPRSSNTSRIEQDLSAHVKFRLKWNQEGPVNRTEGPSQIESPCFHDSIIYDRFAPRNLSLTSTLAQATNQKQASFNFEATDHPKNRIRFECKLFYKENEGDQWPSQFTSISCPSENHNPNSSRTSGSITYPSQSSLEDGHYKFSIRAIDELGNATKPEEYKEYEWTINSTVSSISFSESEDSPCVVGNPTEMNSLIDTIPIEIDTTSGTNPSFPFTVQCKKKGNNNTTSFEDVGTINELNPTFNIGRDCFNKTPLTVFNDYPPSVIDDYSENTIYQEYTLEVQARSRSGTTTRPQTCTWKVLPETKQLTVFNQTPLEKKVDILFIVDHSEMIHNGVNIGQNLGNSFKGFIESLSSLDWQIAIASMERTFQTADNYKQYYFGEFLAISEIECTKDSHRKRSRNKDTDRFILKYTTATDPVCWPPLRCSTSRDKLQNTFIRTMKCPGFTGEGDEYGIQAAHQILTQYKLGEKAAYTDFFRNDAALVMIFITNEPNCESSNNSNCRAKVNSFDCGRFNNYETSDLPDELIRKVKCTFQDENESEDTVNKKFLAYPIVPSGFSNTEHYVHLAQKTQGRTSNSTPSLTRVDINEIGTIPSDVTKGKYIEDLVPEMKDDIMGETISLDCENSKPRNEFPASGGSRRISSPTYLFKPRNGEEFIKMKPPSSYNSTTSSNVFSFITTNDLSQTTTHSIRIEEYWDKSPSNTPSPSNRASSLNKVRFIPVNTTPILPDGTYKVDYSCL